MPGIPKVETNNIENKFIGNIQLIDDVIKFNPYNKKTDNIIFLKINLVNLIIFPH